ncbi:MAG TPA: DUF4271 domain-containing protein [Adhaeribacter sp.]|nr:DUF4271 domain-containing protein [Adhaeribacter sp.]
MPIKQQAVNVLSSDWLVSGSGKKHLQPYIPGVHTSQEAFYQWLTIRPEHPFEIAFPATEGLCIYLNNRLIFKADSAAGYTIDLTSQVPHSAAKDKYLLAVWSPDIRPKIEAFSNVIPRELLMESSEDPGMQLQNQVIYVPNQNAFIVFLLLIGLIYGSLRTSFSADFNSVLRVGDLFRTYSAEEGFLAKPIGNWSGILFVAAFSLSLSMLIVAIYTNLQDSFIFNHLFRLSERAITTRIIFDAILIFALILLKYVFLHIMAYIFDLSGLVVLQYREFLRSMLFMGMFLPFVMLFYLAFNKTYPGTVLLLATLAVSTLLILTAIRVVFTLNKKVPLRNLHLFSYICATEIIPLAVMLKLIVFNY